MWDKLGFLKDSLPRMHIEGGIGSGKNVRLSRVVYEKGIAKDTVIMID